MSAEEPMNIDENESITNHFKNSFKLMNTNITGYMFAQMEETFKKEFNKSSVKLLKGFLKDVSASVDVKVENLFTENNLIPKLDALESLANKTDKNNKPKCIYEDTDETFEALLFKSKKKHLERITEFEQDLDIVISSLKSEINTRHAEFIKESQLKN